jgi:hypothetical protein
MTTKGIHTSRNAIDAHVVGAATQVAIACTQIDTAIRIRIPRHCRLHEKRLRSQALTGHGASHLGVAKVEEGGAELTTRQHSGQTGRL